MPLVERQLQQQQQQQQQQEAAPPTGSAPSFAELVKFTILAMPIYISPSLMSLIDTAAVGQVSSVDLAAMGPACAILDGVSNMMVFISVGTTNSVSTAVGDNDRAAAKRAASVSVTTSFAIGCVVAALLVAAIGPVASQAAAATATATATASASSSAQQLWSSCSSYVKIRALSFPFQLVLLSAQASCLGAKDSKSPTVATLLASVVNVAGDWLLVMGPPKMGIAGAAWATVGCQVVAAAALLRTLRRKGLVDRPSLLRVPGKKELKKFFAFGAFIFVLVSKTAVYNQAVLLATILGPAQGAAHQVLYSLSRFCYTLGDVTGATAQAFLPQYYKKEGVEGGRWGTRKRKRKRRRFRLGRMKGEVEEEEEEEEAEVEERLVFDAVAARGTIKKVVAMTAAVAAVATTTCLSIPMLLPQLFTGDPEVAALMRRAAPFAALGLSMHPSVVGMEGCLLATRDIKWLVGNYVATGVASVAATQLLLRVGRLRSLLNLEAIWVYLAVYQSLRFTTFLWRLLLSTRRSSSGKT